MIHLPTEENLFDFLEHSLLWIVVTMVFMVSIIGIIVMGGVLWTFIKWLF